MFLQDLFVREKRDQFYNRATPGKNSSGFTKTQTRDSTNQELYMSIPHIWQLTVIHNQISM